MNKQELSDHLLDCMIKIDEMIKETEDVAEDVESPEYIGLTYTILKTAQTSIKELRHDLK